MLETDISASISTIFQLHTIKTRSEKLVLVKFLYGRIFGDFSPQKVGFLESGDSDWPWRWRVGFLGYQPHFLRAGFASDKVELEIDLPFSLSTYTKLSIQYLDVPRSNQISPALAPLDISSMGILNTFPSPNFNSFTQHSLENNPPKPWHPTKISPYFQLTYCDVVNAFFGVSLCFPFAEPSPLAHKSNDNFFSVIYCVVHEIRVFKYLYCDFFSFLCDF
jgi:hypothetical protein